MWTDRRTIYTLLAAIWLGSFALGVIVGWVGGDMHHAAAPVLTVR